MNFDKTWWARFREAWNNAPEERLAFGRLGTIRIEIDDGVARPATLMWNQAGALDIIHDEPPSTIPTFTASSETWSAFLGGQASAARLVMLGKIHYRGPPTLLLTYARHFDLLGVIGGRVSRS